MREVSHECGDELAYIFILMFPLIVETSQKLDFKYLMPVSYGHLQFK